VPIRVVRLGSPRRTGEEIRLGTVRRPPRGVKKTDFAHLDYYDVWLPELAPSSELVSWALSKRLTDQRWAQFVTRYTREMRQPAAERLLILLAAMSTRADFSVGCYCEDEGRCHRSVLRQLLRDHGAAIHVDES